MNHWNPPSRKNILTHRSSRSPSSSGVRHAESQNPNVWILPEPALCTFFEMAEIPFCVLHLNGSIMYSGKSFLKLLGYSDLLEINGHSFWNFLVDHKTLEFHKENQNPISNVEIQLKRKSGEVISVFLSAMRISFFQNKEALLCILKEKWISDQLLHSQKLTALGQLTSGIAHDFNNLISGIIGCASILLSEIDPQNPVYEDIQTILSASQKAADLVGRLLAYSREVPYQKKPTSINTLIQDLLNMLVRTFRKDIQIRPRLAKNLATVEADANDLQQALLNICLNSRDAMPEGGRLTIETKNLYLNRQMSERKSGLLPGMYVQIRIRDTGIGMDRETQEKIFEPFFTTKQNQGGNGLGLAIAYEIIKKHHGGIFVKSQVGKGTVFEILLPASFNISPREEKEKTRAIPKGNETLLLVDDEMVIRRMGKRLFERFGYRVLMAPSGAHAIRLIKTTPKIDLLILDKVMPKMDGLETFRRIKQIRPNMKALLTSGYVQLDSSEEFKKEGFLGFIPKPFSPEELLRIVRESLDTPPCASG